MALETDQQVGLAPPELESDENVGVMQRAETGEPPVSQKPESDADVGIQPAAPQGQSPELEQSLLQRARTIGPIGMAATGLEALRRVTEAKLGFGTPERGRTVPEIQSRLLSEPEPTLTGELTQPTIRYQPFKVEKDDHWAVAAGKEGVNIAVSIPEFFTSPLGVITPAAGAEAPVTTGLAFTADMLYNLGKGLISTIKGWRDMSTGQKAASIVDLGANGVMALAIAHGTKKAAEEWLYKPAAGKTVPPEVQAWAATFGVGTGEPVTDIRSPQARVVPTQGYVPPQPGPMAPIPPLTTATTAPPAAAPTTTDERTTDVTSTGTGQQQGSQETQLQGVREGQDLQTHATEVRQASSGQATGGGGPEPSPQGQAAPPAPDVVLKPEVARLGTNQNLNRFGDPIGTLYHATPEDWAQYEELGKGNLADPETWQARENIRNRYGGMAPVAPKETTPPVAAIPPVAAAPPVLPVTPAETGRPPKGNKVEFTGESIQRAQALIAQVMTFVRERELTPEDKRAAGQEIENVRQGYFTGMEELIAQLQNSPVKQRPALRPPTDALDRFDAETEQLKDQIGEEDILSWLRDKMPMLSKSGFKKKFGARRAKENASLYEGAPGKGEIPMHHQVAIYSENGDGPDVVAKSAAREGKLKGVTEETASADDLWDAVRQAIRVRKGATGETGSAGIGAETESQHYARLEREAEQHHLNWVARTKEAEPGKEVPITADQLGVGDVLEVDGERVKVVELDPDTEELILRGGKNFGEQRVREGDPVFYVQRHIPAAEAEFLPEETAPVEPAKPELPKVPGPMPKGIPEADREEAFRQHRARWDKYNADIAAWEAAQPQNRPIIFRREGGTHAAITPDPQGGWRVTTFSKLYRDLDKIAPWGHERYNTRLEAVQGMLSSGRDGEIVDHLPEVMTEAEIAEERTRRNPPPPAAPAAPVVPPPTLRPGEQAGELFQGADQPFNLAGQKGTDADRIAAERAAAEARAKEAADLAAKQQPDLPAEPPKPAAAPVGTRVDNYVKGEDGWYLVDKEGNKRNLPRANKKISARLEAQAVAPPAPPETRSPIEILSQAQHVRITVPDGALIVRVTDERGRTSQEFIAKANKPGNSFRNPDAPYVSIEAGFINSKKQFQRVEGEIKVEDVSRQRPRDIAPETPLKPLPVEDVTAHIAQQFGVAPGGLIEVVNNPNVEWRGESDLSLQPGAQRNENGKFPYAISKIRINAAKLASAADVTEVVEHELAHVAAETLGHVIKGLTPEELTQIVKDVQERGYPANELNSEVRARSITALADSWKTRNWFEKAVGTVMAWANKVGVPLTRLAAERIAARAIADQLTLIRRGSVINQPAVEQVVHSLPLKPDDWHMKEFFNAIGLQASTIGGYLHRYTRQVFHADALEASDRARALDGMNEARDLVNLSQGMGGRANYYDAVANAATFGERQEVIKDAFESLTLYQQRGVDLRRKVAEKLEVLQSEKFRNKITRASQKLERAEMLDEVRRTFTLQTAAAAGRITQTLNDLRTVGGMHEQLQQDLTRLQTLPQFDNAVAQHFNAIVDSLAQTDRGLSLLMGGGERTGQDIWDEYLRSRFANNLGIPQGNEFTLGQLASAVLAANRDLRNQFASLALLSRDIVTNQEWNRAGSMIAQAIQNDPQAAIPRILQRASNVGDRAARAEAAWLTLHKSIERTLRDYAEHEQAVSLHNAVETDPEYRRWVNDVLNNPSVQGLAIPEDIRGRMEEAKGGKAPFFKYSGQETIYSPDGKPYQINLQYTPDNVQTTMGDLIKLSADISEWLDRPENQNNPSRLYWQERQRLLEGTLMSSAIWHPGAIESLVTKSSFGMPENFYQGLALPSAKLAFLAQKAFDRYWTQGKGWYGSGVDLSERAIELAYKAHGKEFNELNRKAYQRAYLNAIAWEFRNGRDVRVGDNINGHIITQKDLNLLNLQGRMTSDLFDRMWNTARASGAEGVMELPRIVDEFTGGAWGIRRPMEIGVHKDTTLPHTFSNHGEALANQVHSLIAARNAELTRLPQRVIDEAMTPEQRNAAHADIINRFYDSIALTLNDPDVFQNAVLGFMRQRVENWIKLDGLSPFEEHYREITRMVSAGDPAAPATIEQVLDYLNQHMPEDVTPQQVRKQFFDEWEKLTERFYKMHSEADTGVKVTSDKRATAFTQGFRQDLGPAYFYDYGWINDGEMRRYSTDMGEFGFERMMESMRALKQNINEAVAELSAAAEERKPEIVRRTMEQYHQGTDFRNLQTLQDKGLELDRLIAGMPKWIGADAVHAEGISLKSMSRFVSFMIGAALTGPRTAARISGISMGGSAWKMGIVFSQLGYGRLRSFPAAAASAITSAFRVGTATGLGWYHPGKGFVPGVPIRILLNIPGAARAALANTGSERIYSAIEAVLKGTTDEQFAALGWWFDQKALGMTPDTALGSRVAAILSASRTKGGALALPETIPTTRAGAALRGVKLALSKPWALGEAFVAGTNVYLPGAFGYNITYDAVGRQAGWYIDMLAANARRTFDTYERLGQLGRFNFDNLTDPRNKLLPWEVLPTFANRFRFVDPARLPAWARPNSTNLQFARELFSTSTDIDLQDLMLKYWDRLRRTPSEQRGAVEFLAPEEMDAAAATQKAEGRARGIISRFVEQTHHAAPSNRPHQLQQAHGYQAILPFVGWSAQTLKLIDATLGKVAFSAEARGVQADTYAGLVIAAAVTALGVSAFAFAGGDLEARMIRELDRLLHNKEGTVKTIDEARDMKEAAEITLHNMTAGIPLINSALSSILGFSGYRGGSAGFQAFAFDKVNSLLTYARDVYRTHDLTHGLDRLAEANIPISETIIENTFSREGLQNNRNAVRVLQKFGPQDLVERRASLSISLPTEMTPYRQALVEAIGSGDQALVAKTYQEFIEKATELGRSEPDKLARQMFSTLNPYRQAFGGVLTDQQRADTLAKMSPVQRKMVETMEQNFGLAAATLGLSSEFEKQEKAPPIQRAGAGGAGGSISLGPTRAAAAGGGAGLSRIGTGLRRISLSGPKPPRIRLPGLGGIKSGPGVRRASGSRTRYVQGRLRARASKIRRVSTRRSSKRRISLNA